jgi:N6-adenosine-specific RNA methylase IME4
MSFDGLPRGHYGAILADPPWHFVPYSHGPQSRVGPSYSVMSFDALADLPVADLAADNSVLFCWGMWVMLSEAMSLIDAWGFQYKTCAFSWIKANTQQIDMFRDDADGDMGLGYWVRQGSEFCLLATRGNPKRLNADVRQAIIAPRREHSRKPDGIHERIERLVAGPYLELFARQRRPGWDCWGNETDKFAPQQQVSRETPADSWSDMWAKPFDFSKEPKGNPG